MSIIDTSSWIDAFLAGQRSSQAQENQAFQREAYQQAQEDRRRRLAQEQADQQLAGSLYDYIAGNPIGTSRPPTDYVNGPPTMAEMQAQQAVQPGTLNPQTRQLLTSASPAAGSRFLDDYRSAQANLVAQRLQMEEQASKQRIASMYEPIIRAEFPPNRQTEALVLLDAFANTPMTADQFRRALRQMQDEDQARSQNATDAQYIALNDPGNGVAGPGPNPAAVSPDVLMRMRGYQNQYDLLNLRQDNAIELRGIDQNNRLGTIDYRAQVAAQAKQLSPEEFEQQVQDVMASNLRAGRVEAEAYVRGRHDGLFNQIRPNISGATRSPALTQADKDAESYLKVQIDSRERQLKRVEDQIRAETDAKRKSELISRANGINSEIVSLESDLMEMLRTRSSDEPSGPPVQQTPQSSAAPPALNTPTTHIPVVPPTPVQSQVQGATPQDAAAIDAMRAAVRQARLEGLTDPAQIRARVQQILSGSP